MQMKRNMRRAQSAQNGRFIATLMQRLNAVTSKIADSSVGELRKICVRSLFPEIARVNLAAAECMASSAVLDDAVWNRLDALRRDVTEALAK